MQTELKESQARSREANYCWFQQEAF